MEGDLVHHAPLDAAVAAALHQRDLVMLLRVGAQEDDLWITRHRELAAVRDLEAQQLGVEGHHGLDVVYVNADVAEANAGNPRP